MKTAPILIAFAFMSAVDLLRRYLQGSPNATIHVSEIFQIRWWIEALGVISSALMLVTGLIALMSRIAPRPASLMPVYLLLASAAAGVGSLALDHVYYGIDADPTAGYGWIGLMAENLLWSILYYAALIQLVILADGPQPRGFSVEPSVQAPPTTQNESAIARPVD